MPFYALPLASGVTNGAAYNVSDDGHVVVGYTSAPGDNDSVRLACYWVDGAGPTTIDSTFSEAYGVSHDGSVIAGNGHTGTPFRWTASTGAVPFSTSNDSVQGMSADGSTIIGGRQVGGNPQACYWDATGTIHLLGYLPGHDYSNTLAVSADGSVIVGTSIGTSAFLAGRAFRWTAATGMVDLGIVGTTTTGSRGFGVSSDGSIVVGGLTKPSQSDAFRWTAATGMVEIPVTVMYNAIGVSGDGSTIVGINGALGDSSYFCYLTSSGLVTPDGNPTDPENTKGTFVNAVNGDGTHMVGYSYGSDVLPWLYIVGGPVDTLTDAELFFTPTTGFVDFTDATQRGKFVDAAGTPQWLGVGGGVPFGGPPSVYLRAEPGNPDDFAQNNGVGGRFAITGTLTQATTAPACVTYFVTEAATEAGLPEWRLSVSDDGGRTWSTVVKPRSMGTIGEYRTRLRWLKMGQFRQRVFKLESSSPTRRNIVGFYTDDTPGMA